MGVEIMTTNYADDRIVKVVINRNDAKVDFQNQGRFGVSMRDVRPCLENGNQLLHHFCLSQL